MYVCVEIYTKVLQYGAFSVLCITINILLDTVSRYYNEVIMASCYDWY